MANINKQILIFDNTFGMRELFKLIAKDDRIALNSEYIAFFSNYDEFLADSNNRLMIDSAHVVLLGDRLNGNYPSSVVYQELVARNPALKFYGISTNEPSEYLSDVPYVGRDYLIGLMSAIKDMLPEVDQSNDEISIDNSKVA
jgi:hypothetical protein